MSDSESELGAELRRLPVAAQRRIEARCTRFEQRWRSGERPRLESELAEATGAERSVLLSELLGLDIEYRQRLGERPEPGEYGLRFPEHGVLIARIFQETRGAATDSHPQAFSAEPAHRVNDISSAARPPQRRNTPTPGPRWVALIEGDTPHLSREIQGLLQVRLRVVAVFVGAASLTYLLASIFAQTESMQLTVWRQVETALLTLIMAAIAVLCWTRHSLPVPWLRGIELVAFAAPALLLAHEQIQGSPLADVLHWAGAGHRGEVASLYASSQGAAWSLLILGYGILIPNTGRRCTSVVLSLAAVPVLAELASSRVHGSWPYLGTVLF